MNRPEDLRSINCEGLLVGIVLIVFLTKLSSYLTPFQMYFSFSSFLLEETSNARWLSLTIKLLIPAIVGYLLYALPFYWMLKASTSHRTLRAYYRYLKRQSAYTAVAAGVGAAILQTWPVIEYWDVLMPPEVNRFRVAFLFVYFLYFIAYGYFALVGIYLAKIYYRARLPAAESKRAVAAVRWADAIKATVIASTTTAIAGVYGHLLSNPSSFINN